MIQINHFRFLFLCCAFLSWLHELLRTCHRLRNFIHVRYPAGPETIRQTIVLQARAAGHDIRAVCNQRLNVFEHRRAFAGQLRAAVIKDEGLWRNV